MNENQIIRDFTGKFDAKWFFRRFIESITWEKYEKVYKKDADFTPVVTSVINEIIEDEIRKLEIAAKLITLTDFYPSIARDREEILLILGSGCSAQTGKSDYTSFDYRGYLFHFDTEKFIKF